MTPRDFIKTSSQKVNRVGKRVCVFLPNTAKDFFKHTITEVVKKLGCESKSFLDFPVGNGLENIWRNMLEAGVVIVDISRFSPSVMFELGASLTCRDAKEVIIICEEEYREQSLPFNIGTLNINYYDKDDDDSLKAFEKKLYDDIESVLINYTIEDPISNPEARKLLEKAIEAIDKRDWLVSKILFDKADGIEPSNWKIHKDWAQLYRLSGEGFQKAHEKAELALSFAKHPIHKAEIYIEFALLYDSANDRTRAVTAFNQSEELHKNNSELYMAWNKFYVDKDEPKNALEKILKLMELDKKNQEAKSWFDYLTLRISDRSYKKTFEEFMVNPKRKKDDWPNRENILDKTLVLTVPTNISWEDFQATYPNRIVKGTIESIRGNRVFVELNRSIKGVMYIDRLRPEYKATLRPRLQITVRIKSAFIDPRDNRRKVNLTYWVNRKKGY